MPALTYEQIGISVVAVALIIVFVKYFTDATEKRNNKDTEFLNRFMEMNERVNNSLAEMRTCLQENTLATRSTREYLEKVENQTNEKLKDHDKRLDHIDERVDSHDKELVKINSQIEITLGGKNE